MTNSDSVSRPRRLAVRVAAVKNRLWTPPVETGVPAGTPKAWYSAAVAP